MHCKIFYSNFGNNLKMKMEMKNKILSWLFSEKFWKVITLLFFNLTLLETSVMRFLFNEQPSNFKVLMIIMLSIAMNESKKQDK